MATDQFVVDGNCHPYNFSEENLKGTSDASSTTCCMLSAPLELARGSVRQRISSS